MTQTKNAGSRRPPHRRFLPALAFALGAALTGSVQAAQNPEEPWDICGRRTAEAEFAASMPTHLLTAVSKVESGRWNADTGEILAWPWTVTAGKEGRFLPSKAAAIAEVERLRAKGVTNIDVGCMQINLHFHPKAFDSLEQAFDPDRNIAYAIGFLRGLRDRWGSWTRAVGSYHSNTPALSGRYRLKVLKMVYAEKHRAAKKRRAARLAAVQASAQLKLHPPSTTPVIR
jgi:soluble lytic murein transglycosylase-like protein